MHKLFLTRTECEIINGASDIINVIGGFPSMEDGELVDVKISRHAGSRTRGDISLTFDITGWKRVASNYTAYGSINDFNEDRIRITFKNVRDIKILDPFLEGGEIKFSNTTAPKTMHQDDHPSNTPIIERPFCRFYIRSGSSIVLDFDEDECIISADLFMSIDEST